MQELQKRTSTSISAESEQRMRLESKVSDSNADQCHYGFLYLALVPPQSFMYLPCDEESAVPTCAESFGTLMNYERGVVAGPGGHPLGQQCGSFWKFVWVTRLWIDTG